MNTPSAQPKNHRGIYVFAADADNASFITQKSILTDQAGLKERDICVHEIIGARYNQLLFKKYKAAVQGFTFILVGKDGGEKLRSTKPVSLKKLFGTIDAMPMRKQEMKN